MVRDPMVRYPHVRLENAERVVVHIAFDQHLPEHILFFSPRAHIDVGAPPTHTFNIGIMPNIGNYVYTRMPANYHHVLGMQKYTRVFEALKGNTNL